MKWYTVYFLFAVGALLLLQCTTSAPKEESPYLNVKDPAAHYVGMQECKTCHASVYESFMKTGMGQSWGLANRSKSAANFSPDKALVYDKIKDLYYKPFWRNDSLFIQEFRLEHKDTIHQRTEYVHYIVGSGQHTNSHITETNGYLHQAPITFYTQKGTWDLAPGFEGGQNSRFDRKIEPECITCHNGYPTWVEGSLNKYTNVPLGIDCERCHGPGSVHVSQKRNGEIVDTSKGIDYSIVNPGKLSTELQNNLCQRCHLQGVTVLQEGKSFFDFKPSQHLRQTMNTFMPVYSEDEDNMIMASHVERMKQSACYVTSQQMSCITCHNPHVSVKETPLAQYNTACVSCHAQNKGCKEDIQAQAKVNMNCVQCHMPKNKSIDIPHVAVTDHRIRIVRKELSSTEKVNIARFVQMQCYNNDQVDPRNRAKAFLEFYERYVNSANFLDSALMYLGQAKAPSKTLDQDLIRTYFLQEHYADITALVKDHKPSTVFDAWTNYRIGEAYAKQNNYAMALPFLQQACKRMPFALDFQVKLGVAYIQTKQQDKAKQVFEYIVNEDPGVSLAWFNLAYLADQQQDLIKAEQNYITAIRLNPDHVQSLINLAVIYYRTEQKTKIKPLILRALKIEPDNKQLLAMLSSL